MSMLSRPEAIEPNRSRTIKMIKPKAMDLISEKYDGPECPVCLTTKHKLIIL